MNSLPRLKRQHKASAKSFLKVVKEDAMDTMFEFAAVVMTTIVALFAALGLQALLLRGVFALMQAATADRRRARAPIEQGTRLAARAYAKVL
jgi:hypothetical protein